MWHPNTIFFKSGIQGSSWGWFSFNKKPKDTPETFQPLKLVPDLEVRQPKIAANMSLAELVSMEKRLFRFQMVLLAAFTLTVTLGVTYWELTTSGIEAHTASLMAPHLRHEITEGKNPDFRAPPSSPYDSMLGYSQLPHWIERLESRGYQVDQQAGLTPFHRALVGMGLHPIYHEKTVHGLKVFHKDRGILYNELFPRFRYESYQQIPYLVRETLLFIEDRQILDEKKSDSLNPAISWERLFRAAFDLVLDKTISNRNVPGGSTLATQIEKFRHSPEGRTHKPSDKLKQIASASLRSYLLGKDTTTARHLIITNYINEVPLGAANGFGEVRGLGEALQVWFRQDLSTVNRLLNSDTQTLTTEDQLKKAKAYKQVLALFLSQRRPTYYLLSSPQNLDILTKSYLRLMAAQGVIPGDLATLAMDQPLDLIPSSFSRHKPLATKENSTLPNPGAKLWSGNKAAYAVRTELKQVLNLQTLYQLDRMDADIQTSYIPRLQERITSRLQSYKTEVGAQQAGLVGERMLHPGQAPTVDYSFTLIESISGQNAVRVQTDTLQGPFDLNRGGKLELGSTAKLRTLVTYLEMIADLYEAEIKKPISDLPLQNAQREQSSKDDMTQFVRDYLASQKANTNAPQGTLKDLLQLALKREFSASPYQSFWTGGGRITFNNFNDDENALHLSVIDGFRKSNNLVFVRIMRDIVQHVIHTRIPDGHELLSDPNHPLRSQYLERFIELESKTFLRKFFREFRNKNSDLRFDSLVKSKHITSSRIASLILSLRPDYDYMAFRLTMKQYLPLLDEKHIQSSWHSINPLMLNLADRAFLAKTHPIALWTALYLDVYPNASWSDILFDSRHMRMASYDWLRSKSGTQRQERDILTMLERDAFRDHIYPYWKRQGFPFDTMTPTLASALGSSGDRPSALADLMGAIHNDGMLLPTKRIESITIGRSTPFETRLSPSFHGGRRAMRPEVAETALHAVHEVVSSGTARRLKGSIYKSNGEEVLIAAKTGTGDNRLDVHNAQGALIRSDAKNRTATLIFGIGENFYGTITAYVSSQNSNVDHFQFTSSLVVQGLKSLLKDLEFDILNREEPSGAMFREPVSH